MSSMQTRNLLLDITVEGKDSDLPIDINAGDLPIDINCDLLLDIVSKDSNLLNDAGKNEDSGSTTGYRHRLRRANSSKVLQVSSHITIYDTKGIRANGGME